jgi:ABC-type antimicrobial peptide transport system ATPase subunit
MSVRRHPLTAEQQHRQNPKLDRHLRTARRIRAVMRDRGSSLHLQHVNGYPCWFLSDGTRVRAAVASTLISHPHIVDVGDALPFTDVRMTAQTYRYWHGGNNG